MGGIYNQNTFNNALTVLPQKQLVPVRPLQLDISILNWKPDCHTEISAQCSLKSISASRNDLIFDLKKHINIRTTHKENLLL